MNTHPIDHVALVGFMGVVATLTLDKLNVIVSIAAGVASLIYVVLKTYRLLCKKPDL